MIVGLISLLSELNIAILRLARCLREGYLSLFSTLPSTTFNQLPNKLRGDAREYSRGKAFDVVAAALARRTGAAQLPPFQVDTLAVY